MKKLVLAIFIGSCLSIIKADNILEPILPSTATINSTTVNNSSVTISAPGSRKRNCITDLQVIVNANSTLSIKDGTTDIYVVDLSTANIFSPAQSLPFDVEWVVDPICAGYNSKLQIVQSTGTAKINYKGQIRGQ